MKKNDHCKLGNMKRRIILLFILAMGVVAPLKAQDLYVGLGYSTQAGAVRVGLDGYVFGAEVMVKSDYNRIFKSIPDMDGRRHRFSAMGGLRFNLSSLFHLTANVGYGSTGIYRQTSTPEGFGVEGMARGVEAGFIADVFLGDVLSVFVGWSHIFPKKNDPYSEFTMGLGFNF